MGDMDAVLDAIGTLPDAEIDLADAALQLARIDAPDADWQATRDHLSEMARNIAGCAKDAGDLVSRPKMLADLLCDHYDYRGDTDTYDDLANANLLRVIERRRGMPVALGVLWLHAATAAGWPAYGLDLPGHFVIALADTGRRLMVDVFASGSPRDESAARQLVRRTSADSADALLADMTPMTNRAVLVRLQHNILLRRLQSGDMVGALCCAEQTLRAAPDTAFLWREVANLQERLDRVNAALFSYGRFLSLTPPEPAAGQARAAMDDLRTRLN